MSEHLPDVKGLTPEQEVRARDLCNQMTMSYWGLYSAARVIVSLQDRLAQPAHERESPHCSTCACGMPAEPPAVSRQRYSIHGVLTPISENGVPHISLTDMRRAAVHDVYLCSDVDGTPSTTEAARLEFAPPADKGP